jgi:hypothetical protein
MRHHLLLSMKDPLLDPSTLRRGSTEKLFTSWAVIGEIVGGSSGFGDVHRWLGVCLQYGDFGHGEFGNLYRVDVVSAEFELREDDFAIVHFSCDKRLGIW